MESGSTTIAGSAALSQPLFRAIAGSTKQLYQLLKCINFTDKAHVEITEDGIKFSAESARVMHGMAFLDKALFTTYSTNLPRDDDTDAISPRFQISLPALLETLQILGAAEAASRAGKDSADPYRSNLRNYRPDAFSAQTLGMPGTCCLIYEEEGAPLSVILEESGVKTTCNLVTYLPEAQDDIPFDKDDVAFKIIMHARYLLDALAELAPSTPERLTIVASRNQPYLSLSSSGALGSTSVDFARGRDLLETFYVDRSQPRWVQAFKFDMVKSASEAMRIASKVSFRGDKQGVLSLQFMVEVEGGGVNFLDFRFVPYVTMEDEDDEETEDQD